MAGFEVQQMGREIFGLRPSQWPAGIWSPPYGNPI